MLYPRITKKKERNESMKGNSFCELKKKTAVYHFFVTPQLFPMTCFVEQYLDYCSFLFNKFVLIALIFNFNYFESHISSRFRVRQQA